MCIPPTHRRQKELARRSGADGRGKRGPIGEPLEYVGRDQLKASRELQGEGLEGLPARAKDLLILGGTFWLGLLPVVLVVGGLMYGVYAFNGEAFIHRGGAPPPPQVNPYKVMNEPTVDRMVPFYKGIDLNAQLENDQEVERLTKKGRKQVCTEVPSGEQVCADVAS